MTIIKHSFCNSATPHGTVKSSAASLESRSVVPIADNAEINSASKKAKPENAEQRRLSPGAVLTGFGQK
jgi:hypothetical protein